MIRKHLVAIVLAVIILSGGPNPLSRLAVADEAKAGNDADRIQGHWVSVRTWQHGHEDSQLPTHCVFTDKELKLLGFAWEYKLDPSQTPKHLDLEPAAGISIKQRGIYRFEGDKLWLCIPLSSKGPRPDDFTSRPSDKLLVILAERGKPTADGRPSLIAPGFALADERLTRELHASLAHVAELLEKNHLADCLKELMAPDDLAEMLKRNNSSLEDFSKIPLPKNRAAGLAKTFHALEKKIPALSSDGTWAYFDLQDVHFNGAPGKAAMFFRKVDGRWCMTEKTPAAPRN